MANTAAERVQKMMRDLGNLNQPSFGALAGASKSLVNQWLSGEIKSISAKYAFRLQRKTGFNAEWIQLGEGPERITESSERAISPLSASASRVVSVINLLDATGENHDLLEAAEVLLRRALPAQAEAARGNPELASLLEQYTRDPASLTPESFTLLRKRMAGAALPAAHPHDEKTTGKNRRSGT